jgi:hypothetical protein
VLEILAEISKILTPLLVLTSPHSRVCETRLLVELRWGKEGRLPVVYTDRMREGWWWR